MKNLKDFEVYLLKEDEASSSTILTYIIAIKEFLSHAHNPPTVQDIDNYKQQLNERESSLNTKRIKFSALHKYFKFIERADLISYVSEKRSKLKGDEAFIVYDLDDKKVEQLREAINKDKTKEAYRDRLVLELLDSTAARVSEIRSLKISDFDFERRMIKIYQKKQRRYREVRLTSQTENALKEYQIAYAIEDKLFTLTNQNVFYLLEKRCREAKIKFYSSHKFRHHRLTEWAKLVSLQELQAVSGHSSLDALKRYLHIRAEDVFKKIERAEAAVAVAA